jgi:hypothetical protein
MRSILLIVLSLVIFSSSAKTTNKIEINPFAGYRFGGEFDSTVEGQEIELDEKTSFGVVVAWPYDNRRQGELLFSHYETNFTPEYLFTPGKTDLSVSYLHIGGNLPLSQGAVPFWLSGGLGVTHLSPENKNLDDETRFSTNLGFHTRFQLNDNIALKFGARIYATFFNSESEVFCDSENCTVYVSSEVWIQNELSAGLVFTF